MKSFKEGRLKDIYVPLIFFALLLIGGAIAATVTKNLFVAVTIGNNVPIVFGNNSNTSITLTDSQLTEVTFQFNVTDADGTGNIDLTQVGVNVSFNGVKRQNNSGNCAATSVTATTNSYTCKVVFRYYDNSSNLWTINFSAADLAGSHAHNDTNNFGAASGGGAARNITVNSLSAYTLMTPSVVSSAGLGSTNNELTVVINNTGNFDFTLINVTPTDLNASLTDIFKLEYNFSINATASTGIGFGVNLTNGTPTNFSDSLLGGQLSATLPHKTSLISGQGSTEGDTKANRTLYIYIDVPNNKGLSSGVTYNTSSSYPWQLIVGTPS